MDRALALEVSALARQREMTEAIEKGDSEIQRFYTNSTVFLTGGSGFLGKQLIEKLLRSCPNVKKVYMLLRTKKGKTLKERLDKILRDPLYETLRKRMPDFADRLETVEGDITEIRLGLSEENWNTITHEAEIIFHVAATTSFDMPLKAATITNVRGTREVLSLAKECCKLKSFVYVSTAYSHATYSRIKKTVEDNFYPAPVSPETIIGLVEYMEEKKLAEITPAIIADWPNTYSFTKAIAEQAVRKLSKELPICVVRPSIVMGSNAEPTPGWLDFSSIFGASGILLGTGMGAVHVLLMDETIIMDMVPVDMVNNAILAAGWDTAERRDTGDVDTKIYSVITSNRNPIYQKYLSTVLRNDVRTIVTPKALWYCYGIEITNRTMYTLLTWIFHYIPAYVVDFVGLIIGKKLGAVKLFTQYYKMTSLMGYYTLNDWKFEDKNTQDLLKKLNDSDRKIFRFDVESIEWREQIVFWYMGIRKYVLKDGLMNTDYAIKKQFWFRILNFFVLALYFYLWWKLLSMVFGVARVFF